MGRQIHKPYSQMSKKTKQQNLTFVTEVSEQIGDFYNTYIHVVEETI